MVFVKIIVLALSIFACVTVIKYRWNMVQMFGKNSLAERFLGSGGSYSMWILIGLLMVFLAATWFAF